MTDVDSEALQAVSARPAAVRASVRRRLASMVYESLLVVAILLVGSFVFFAVVAGLRVLSGAPASVDAGPILRTFLQVFLVAVLGAYFVRCWMRGGQTLAMKAWRLRLVTAEGKRVPMGPAVLRYALALFALGSGALALGLLWRRGDALLAAVALAPAIADLAWALFDRDRQWLHDRIAGTRLVKLEP